MDSALADAEFLERGSVDEQSVPGGAPSVLGATGEFDPYEAGRQSAMSSRSVMLLIAITTATWSLVWN